jgi:hypothetical protein
MLMALLAFYAYTPFTLNSADIPINNNTPLQDSIDGANPGDTLLLDSGTYNATNVKINKSLTIKAADSGVVLGNNGTNSALILANNSTNVSIVGITIQNYKYGFSNTINFWNDFNYGNVTFENCTFLNGTNGLNIYGEVTSKSNNITVKNCAFENNRESIFCYGPTTTVTVESCTIKNSYRNLSLTKGADGHGIEFVRLNNSIIRNCTINNNSYVSGDDQNGPTIVGGAGIKLSSCSNVTVDNCIIDNNTAIRSGNASAMGGIGIVNCSNTLINNSMIRNNTAGYAAGIGVGTFEDINPIFNFNNTYNITIKNCSITGNTATNTANDTAGGLGFNATNNSNIINCLIANNTAPNGGGVSLCNGNLINCSVIDNSAGNYSGVALREGTNNTVSGCIIKNNHGNSSIYVNASNFSISTCDISNNLYDGLFGGVSVTSSSSGSIHFNHFFNNSLDTVFDLDLLGGSNPNVDYDDNWWSGIDPFNSLMLSINEFLRF